MPGPVPGISCLRFSHLRRASPQNDDGEAMIVITFVQDTHSAFRSKLAPWMRSVRRKR